MKKYSPEIYERLEESRKIVDRFNECVDAAKTIALFKDIDYTELLMPYTEIIEKVMRVKGLEPIKALLLVSKTKTFEENGTTQLLLIAATYEILIPKLKAS